MVNLTLTKVKYFTKHSRAYQNCMQEIHVLASLAFKNTTNPTSSAMDSLLKNENEQ